MVYRLTLNSVYLLLKPSVFTITGSNWYEIATLYIFSNVRMKVLVSIIWDSLQVDISIHTERARKS